MAKRDRQQAREAVLQVLSGGDEELRDVALNFAVYSKVDVPMDALLGLAQNDSSALIRFNALAAVTGRVVNYRPAGLEIMDVRAIAEHALSDADTNVKALAQQILGDLDSVEQVPEEQGPDEQSDVQAVAE